MINKGVAFKGGRGLGTESRETPKAEAKNVPYKKIKEPTKAPITHKRTYSMFNQNNTNKINLLSIYSLLILGCCLLLTACNAQNKKHQTGTESMKGHKNSDKHKYTNKLIDESSPYLLQHAHNPVDWRPWGDEALTKAKAEDKLLIISVGYAACHWCHVMEHESFEDSTVAKLMNENFVSIKVDREERPDVDQIYMDACHLVNQRGGWPLNAIALPDGRPIYAGTYYPKEKWMEILNYFINLKETKYAELEENARRLTEGIQQVGQVGLDPIPKEHTIEDLGKVFQPWAGRLDFTRGGRKGAPKFPMPNNYLYLLRYYHATQDTKALEATYATLDNMAFGGIYDHLGGGFARYSTDGQWKVPHFEKMTYDNGQLVSLYSLAYQQSKNPLYKEIVYETLEYTNREMTSPENGFYSSLDADSEGVEGKFYVWDEADIDALLGEDAKLFKEYYTVTKAAQWEHHNILYRTQEKEKIAKNYGLSIEDLDKKIQAGKAILLKERDKRIRPGLDDKILTSWNALMLKGYVDAYRVFGEEDFLNAALKNANFIVKNALQSDNRLNRNFKNGKSSINGFLDDYALTIDAFVALYQATFDEKWLRKAEGLTEYAIQHFFDAESGMFFYTSDTDNPLIARKMEVADNVIPSSNSSMALNLFYLGTYLYKKEYIEKSDQMLNNVKDDVLKNGPFYSNWAILLYYRTTEPYEVAIVGKDWKEKRKEMDAQFLPNVFLLGGSKEGSLELLQNKNIEGQTTIYVCQNKSCKLPVTETVKALNLLK